MTVNYALKTKKCKYCAEVINVEAIKCRHCGEMLNDTDHTPKQLDTANQCNPLSLIITKKGGLDGVNT